MSFFPKNMRFDIMSVDKPLFDMGNLNMNKLSELDSDYSFDMNFDSVSPLLQINKNIPNISFFQFEPERESPKKSRFHKPLGIKRKFKDSDNGKKLMTKDNISKLKNKPGIYKFYDKKGKLIYVGRSKILKHRLQSYTEKDDFNEHPTKAPLRKEIHSFKTQHMSPEQARIKEKKLKNGLKHNHL